MTDRAHQHPPTLPHKLYKFRKVETDQDFDRLRSILEKNELYSSSPVNFNDPFDCRVPPNGRIDPGFARYLICPGNPSTATGRLSQKEKAQLEQVFQDAQGRIDAGGVLPLGAARASMLMWSHYTCDHRGVALEFDTAGWLEHMPCMIGQFHPVLYSKLRVRLNVTRAHYDQAQFFNAIMLTKDICWKSENEWRVITKTPGPLTFPACALTGLIIGCRASAETKAKVKSICDGLPGIMLYQAEMKEKTFGLNFKPC